MPIEEGNILLGNERFYCYWDQYLVKVDPGIYGESEPRKIIHKYGRNGIAHTFLTKPGITITKVGKRPTITRDNRTQWINVDCISLFEDFNKSYFAYLYPRIFAEGQLDRRLINKMALNLSALNAYYVRSLAEDLPHLAPGALLIPTETSTPIVQKVTEARINTSAGISGSTSFEPVTETKVNPAFKRRECQKP